MSLMTAQARARQDAEMNLLGNIEDAKDEIIAAINARENATIARYETALRRIAATVTQATGSPLDDCIAIANEALGDKA